MFQGSRVYDYEADQWTSPDAASGSLDNPFSFRRYLYDNGNANSNSDPSGNAPCPGGVPAGDIGCVANNPTFNNGTNYDNNDIVGEIIGGIVGFFPGLFGGHGHSGGPAVAPQAEPADPETYATFSRAANFANPLGAAIFGIPQMLVPELGAIDAVAAGLGGEVAGAAGIETLAGSAESIELGTGESWNDPSTLADHFVRHGGGFEATNETAYASQASRFFRDSVSEGLPTRIDQAERSEFMTRLQTRSLRTMRMAQREHFFKPSSPTYWSRQPGVSPTIFGGPK